MTAPARRPDHAVILYDGVCVLCSGVVRFIIERDPTARFRFASVQSEVGRRLLAEHGLPLDRWDSFVLVDEDGAAYLRSAAFLRIVPRLSGPWRALAVGRLVPAVLRDGVYDLVARSRYRLFGRRESCMVPTPEIRARFLESEG
jgi:predicted DCC family thiol-disulfide oxidoreductase YuxK